MSIRIEEWPQVAKDYSWMDTAKRHYIRDPVDGGKVLRNESRDTIWAWCEEYCKGEFWIGMGWGSFKLERDAVMFLLRWS